MGKQKVGRNEEGDGSEKRWQFFDVDEGDRMRPRSPDPVGES